MEIHIFSLNLKESFVFPVNTILVNPGSHTTRQFFYYLFYFYLLVSFSFVLGACRERRWEAVSIHGSSPEISLSRTNYAGLVREMWKVPSNVPKPGS
jgi:hypothetical protein